MIPVSYFLLYTWVFILFVLLILWKRSKARGKSLKLPPGPWELPVIGNLHQLAFSSPPHRCLRDLARRYGPVMKLQLGEVLAVVVSSPEIAKQVLKTHDPAFATRPTILAAEVLCYDYSGIVFTPYGDYWRQVRKICVMELLSASRVQSFRSIREEEVWCLIEFITSSKGLPINLSKKLFSLTNGIISRAAFGRRWKHEKEFLSLLNEIITVSGGFDLPDLFPSLKCLGFLTRMKPALQKIQRKLDKVFDDTIHEHKMKRSTTATSNDKSRAHEDLVDVLLRLQEKGELEFSITSNHIKAVTLDVISAGSETSATTLEWAMSELLRNPGVMEKTQDEVRRVLQGRKNIDETDVEKLDYLKLVVKETLRLHPPGSLLPRESTENHEIGGYEIPSKTKVIINTWAMARDPERWIDADCFRPERFRGSNIDFRANNFEFIPFGGGRRICPGISFALATIELTLSQLLYHFNWQLPDGIKPEELDMSERVGIPKRRNDLYVIATPHISHLT